MQCHFKGSNAPLLSLDNNIIIFVTTDKHSFDKGAQELQQDGKLHPLDDLMLKRARVYPSTHHSEPG